MKSCELCKSTAKVYCDSDQARLCWTCDRNVHSANFLVARHSRSLLCRVCHSPTPWTASGETLGPSAVSICEKCVGNEVDADDEFEGENEVDVVEEDVDEDEVEVEEDTDENQVVPLSYTPPPATSCSSSDDCSVGDDDRGGFMKRKRANDDVDCLSVQKHNREPAPELSKPIGGNKSTLYQFLPLNSEAMGEKTTNINISGENESIPVIGVSKRTRTVGLDLNN